MLSSNLIRSRQPHPATSPSPRTLPLSPFYWTSRPILCLPPLSTSPNSTHPTQLDTPVPLQPFCFQSYPHTFRHTWGCASVSTFAFERSTLLRSSRKCPHQYHSQRYSVFLFSHSYALFCTAQNAMSYVFIRLRTLGTECLGWRTPHSSNTQNVEPPDKPKLGCAQVAQIIAAPLKKSWFGTRDDLSSLLEGPGRFASVGRLRSGTQKRALGSRRCRDESSNLSRVRKGRLP